MSASLTAEELELARAIYAAFASTGAPPAVPVGDERLRALAERHVVALGDDGRILMAHPFAAHRDGTRVTCEGREWWGNCPWDGFGIVAALGLEHATIASSGIELEVRGGRAVGEVVFHVAVPARAWWDDIAFT